MEENKKRKWEKMQFVIIKQGPKCCFSMVIKKAKKVADSQTQAATTPPHPALPSADCSKTSQKISPTITIYIISCPTWGER